MNKLGQNTNTFGERGGKTKQSFNASLSCLAVVAYFCTIHYILNTSDFSSKGMLFQT